MKPQEIAEILGFVVMCWTVGNEAHYRINFETLLEMDTFIELCGIHQQQIVPISRWGMYEAHWTEFQV